MWIKVIISHLDKITYLVILIFINLWVDLP